MRLRSSIVAMMTLFTLQRFFNTLEHMGDTPETSDKRPTYVSLPLLDLSAERDFPGDLYLCLHHKIVKFRNKGDKLDAAAFNKLVYNHVKVVFIEERDREAFTKWIGTNEEEEKAEIVKNEPSPEAQPIIEAAAEQRRVMMDIFESPKDDRQVKMAVDTSKKMVSEFLRKPFAINNIQAIQKYSKGCVDHSVNVAVLSVFLGLRMGYSHQLILENLAMGGLFHDIGKILIEPKDEESFNEEGDPALQQHPKLGAEMMEENRDIPNEVRMIVAQHHEYLDGTGYPNKLRGLAIYDLARLVAIANLYDNMISESTLPTMKERANEALDRLERNYEGKLDPKKLEKILKIIRYSFL
jgi:putative nucleotidyltransferase with HDIG domain